jgi:hypothetical protein
VRVRLPIAALVFAPLLVSCGLGSKTDDSMPPLTPEPTITLPPQDATTTRQSYPARFVLYRYLRGIAAGDPRACAYLTPAYDRATFGAQGCRAWVPQVRRRLPAAHLAALRGVTVPVAETGPGAADYTVQFTDLQWRAEPASPGGALASAYVIRRTGTRWLIAG